MVDKYIKELWLKFWIAYSLIFPLGWILAFALIDKIVINTCMSLGNVMNNQHGCYVGIVANLGFNATLLNYSLSPNPPYKGQAWPKRDLFCGRRLDVAFLTASGKLGFREICKLGPQGVWQQFEGQEAFYELGTVWPTLIRALSSSSL